MYKQCKSCGANVPAEARFCQACGCPEFFATNPQPTNFNQVNTNQPAYFQQNQYNQPAQQPYAQQQPYNQPVQQPYPNQAWQQPPVVQNQPKKKGKTGLIIVIVVASLLVLAAIGMIAEKVFQNLGYGDDYYYDYDYIDNSYYEEPNYSDDSITSYTSSSYQDVYEVEYTKGTFDGSVYKNEWADIRLALPIGYSNADAATYATAENSVTECGAYFEADDTLGLIYICFEELPSFPVYDEEDYLDAVMDNIKSLGVSYTIPNRYFTTSIGGYAYLKAECEFDNAYGHFAHTIYVRKIDNYIVFISAMGINSAANDNLVSNIQQY